jgi:hypothetical protein
MVSVKLDTKAANCENPGVEQMQPSGLFISSNKYLTWMKLIRRDITGLISLFGFGKAESVINRGVVMEDCLN